jgi:hypothetical protein
MISPSQCRHHDLFQSLYQQCRADWEEWHRTHSIETESVNAGRVYRAELLDSRCGWWGVPLVHFYKRTRWSDQWPRTYGATRDVPGIIHVAVNFTKPGCVIPVHQVKVDRERIYIGEGDIVSFLPEQHHGSWNNSEEWRVTLYITTERQYWSI